MLYKIIHLLIGGLLRLIYRMKITGRGRVPPGAALVCCNHSSNMDPVLIALALKAADHPRFMAKIELFRVPLFSRLITALGAFPIERGKNDLGAIKATLRYLQNGEKVLMFPEGSRLAAEDLSAAKQGAAMLALKSGAPIVPMYLTRGRKPLVNRVEAVFGDAFYVKAGEGQSREELYVQTIKTLSEAVSALKAVTHEGRMERRGGE